MVTMQRNSSYINRIAQMVLADARHEWVSKKEYPRPPREWGSDVHETSMGWGRGKESIQNNTGLDKDTNFAETGIVNFKNPFLSTEHRHRLFSFNSNEELKAQSVRSIAEGMAKRKENLEDAYVALTMTYWQNHSQEERVIDPEWFKKGRNFYDGPTGGNRDIPKITEYFITQRLIDGWADTSSENAQAIGLQLAGELEFNTGSVTNNSEVLKSKIEKLSKNNKVILPYLLKPDSIKGLRLFLRQQYETTQRNLQKNGIEEVTLFRGMVMNPEEYGHGKIKTVVQNPLSSWSSNPTTAIGFSGGGLKGMSTLLCATFKREQIASTAGTGIGCGNEEEFVVLGGEQMASVIDAEQIKEDLFHSDWNMQRHEKYNFVLKRVLEKTSTLNRISSINKNDGKIYVDALAENADWIDRTKEVKLLKNNLLDRKGTL
jgi:hypothetical protein